MTMIASTRAWLRRFAVALVLVTFVPVATTACFGKFQLIRKVYNFNKRVDPDKWIQWFVFLIMSVFFIYSLAGFIDVVIANSIEFWTGKNPIDANAGTKKVVRGEGGEVATMTLQQDGRIQVEITNAKGEEHVLYLSREAGSVAAHDGAGNLIARVSGALGETPVVLEGALASR